MKKPTIILLSVAVIILGAVGVSVVLYAFRPPVPHAKFRQVKPGMSAEAVRGILGSLHPFQLQQRRRLRFFWHQWGSAVDLQLRSAVA
jgi:hypothetical protein